MCDVKGFNYFDHVLNRIHKREERGAAARFKLGKPRTRISKAWLFRSWLETQKLMLPVIQGETWPERQDRYERLYLANALSLHVEKRFNRWLEQKGEK